MKKKIRFLTDEDMKMICDGQSECNDCPLCANFYADLAEEQHCLRISHKLDKEVEISDEVEE